MNNVQPTTRLSFTSSEAVPATDCTSVFLYARLPGHKEYRSLIEREGELPQAVPPNSDQTVTTQHRSFCYCTAYFSPTTFSHSGVLKLLELIIKKCRRTTFPNKLRKSVHAQKMEKIKKTKLLQNFLTFNMLCFQHRCLPS